MQIELYNTCERRQRLGLAREATSPRRWGEALARRRRCAERMAGGFTLDLVTHDEYALLVIIAMSLFSVLHHLLVGSTRPDMQQKSHAQSQPKQKSSFDELDQSYHAHEVETGSWRSKGFIISHKPGAKNILPCPIVLVVCFAVFA